MGVFGGMTVPFCCYLFVSYTLMAFSAPSTSANFPGLGWQKAASLRVVYCSGYSSGVTVIKRQKAKTHSQIKQKAKKTHGHPNHTIENTRELTLVFGSNQLGLVFQF